MPIELLRMSTLQDQKSDRIEKVDVSGRSDVWKTFLRIKKDGIETRFVQCKTCESTMICDAASGAAALKRHSCVSTSRSLTPKITSVLHKTAPAEATTAVARAAAICVAADLRPFLFVEGSGFKWLAQTLIKLEAKHGNMDIDSVLPSAVTVSRHLSRAYSDLRSTVVAKLAAVRHVGPTCDFWVHSSTSINYLTVTVQYVSGHSTVSRVLATIQTSDKTAATTIAKFEQVLDLFDLNEKAKIVTTDNASAMKLTFNRYPWVGCSAHNLNLVLAHTFGQLSDTKLVDVRRLLSGCKDLVAYMKRSG